MKESVGDRQRFLSYLSFLSFRERPLLAKKTEIIVIYLYHLSVIIKLRI